MQEARAVQMDNHRMGRRPALGRKNFTHRLRVLGIRAEAVDRLRGECDKLTVAQRLHGSLDLDLSRSDNPHHGADSTKARRECP